MANRFILNETSYFGSNARAELPGEIQRRGYKKVLFVTDQTLLDANVATKVTEVLDGAKIKYTTFADIKPNPTIKNVMDGLKVCKKFKADVIVAVGGGSVIDTAKGISILMTNPKRDLPSLYKEQSNLQKRKYYLASKIAPTQQWQYQYHKQKIK